MRAHPYPVPRSWLWQIGATFLYLAIAGSGGVVGAFCLFGPGASGIEMWVLMAWSIATLVPGLSCAYGVWFNRYRWEWVACWPLAAGVGIYAAFTWLTLPNAWGVADALLITAFTLSIAGRGIHLGIIDRTARRALIRQVVAGVTDE